MTQEIRGDAPSRAESTYSHEGPKCPYCGCQVTADDPIYYDETNYVEDDCLSCGKTYDVEVYTSTIWSCEPRATAAEASVDGSSPQNNGAA